MGARKHSNQILVGFALETDQEEVHAQQKLVKKNLDFIVLNSLRDTGAGFAVDTNKITILDKYNKITKFELKDKKEVALDIIDYLKNFIHA
jgi:phosphopantothenoylcysteine decarboxylase/phosphopantothenate--cysteine ligase